MFAVVAELRLAVLAAELRVSQVPVHQLIDSGICAWAVVGDHLGDQPRTNRLGPAVEVRAGLDQLFQIQTLPRQDVGAGVDPDADGTTRQLLDVALDALGLAATRSPPESFPQSSHTDTVRRV